MDDIAQAVAEGRELSTEEGALFSHWLMQRQELGLRRHWTQFIHAAREVNGILDLPDEPEDREQLLYLFRDLAKSTPGGLFRGDDDKLRIGRRQLRDTIAREMKISRPRQGQPASVSLEQDMAAMGSTDELDALDAADVASRIRDAVQFRAAQVKPGSARRHVLDHFQALLVGELTFRDLAEQVGITKSPLQRAFEAEKLAVMAAAEIPRI